MRQGPAEWIWFGNNCVDFERLMVFEAAVHSHSWHCKVYECLRFMQLCRLSGILGKHFVYLLFLKSFWMGMKHLILGNCLGQTKGPKIRSNIELLWQAKKIRIT